MFVNHFLVVLTYVCQSFSYSLTFKSVLKDHNENKRDLFFCVILGSDWQAIELCYV